MVRLGVCSMQHDHEEVRLKTPLEIIGPLINSRFDAATILQILEEHGYVVVPMTDDEARSRSYKQTEAIYEQS